MCQMCDEYEAELRRMGIAMDEVRISTEVERETFEALEQQAREHGHSVDEEVRAILKANVRSARPDRGDMIARLQEFRDALPPQEIDSLTLLREDRDR